MPIQDVDPYLTANPEPPPRLTSKQLDQADEIFNELRGQLTRCNAGLHAQHAGTVVEALSSCRDGLDRIEALSSAIGAKP